MSYGGHAMDMVNRFKENRASIKMRREKSRRIREAYVNSGYIKYINGRPNHKRLTEEQRKEIRQQILEENKRLLWKRIKVFLIVLVLIVLFFYLIIAPDSLIF